jgi:hypothetical protein
VGFDYRLEMGHRGDATVISIELRKFPIALLAINTKFPLLAVRSVCKLHRNAPEKKDAPA